MKLLALLLLVGVASGSDLGGDYLAAIMRADSLYQAGRYPAALNEYGRAHDLLPSEPGPVLGLGWTLLKLDLYPEAEQAFQHTLGARPGQELARQGLALLPLEYRYKFTLTGNVSPGRGNSLTGFVEYNHFYRTTVAFGFQSASVRDSFRGLNTSLVVCRRLRYHWYTRFDFLTLSSANDPRYWRLVYAPALGRQLGAWSCRVTLVGWDWLGTIGLQATGERKAWRDLVVGATPALNLVRGLPGVFVPLYAEYPLRPWLSAKVTVGFGSIADHVDLDIPVLYSQSQRFTATARAGLNAALARRYRTALFGAWEQYQGASRAYGSLTLSVRL